MRGSSVRGVILLLLFCLTISAACAQTVDATRWSSGTVDLSGEQWLSHEGDDVAWAQSGFDDAQWQTVELDELGAAKRGWRWYRLHVKLGSARPHEHLLIVGGEGVYAAYVNGRAVEDVRLRRWYELRRPVEAVIPLRDDATEVTIALRTHTTQVYTLWHLPLFLTVALGTADAIENDRATFESQRMYQALPTIAINFMLILVGFGAFALYRSQPDRTEYLWLGLYLFLIGLSNGLLNAAADGVLPLVWNNLLGDPLVFVVTVMQIQFTFSFAGRQVTRVWQIYRALLIAALFLSASVWLGWLSITPYILIEALAILPAALILPVLLFLWYRRGNREAGWLVLPSLLPAATAALYNVGTAALFTGWKSIEVLTDPIALGPVAVQIADVGDFLFALAIAVVMFFRFTRVSREQMRGAAELEAAREIQRRLVPAQLPAVAGYALAAAYYPAQEVGGDFYQVLLQKDGASLVVLGDVSGKGLKAAMTSTLALGALRALGDEGLGPAAVLHRLNRQVAETSEGGFITCVCIRLAEDGAVTLANAGHLSPYRNGEELVLAPDLPLGIVAECAYAEITVHLDEGEQLTLLSDGVVEARAVDGALLGFDRTRALSGGTAEAIGMEARRFGQEDDITVLTVVRK